MSPDPDTPATINGIVDALAALTDRVRSLEESSYTAERCPDGLPWTVRTSRVIPVAQASSDEAAEAVPSASKLYDEANRATTVPAVTLLARIEALECELAILRPAVCSFESATVELRGRLSTLERRLSPMKADQILEALRARARHSSGKGDA